MYSLMCSASPKATAFCAARCDNTCMPQIKDQLRRELTAAIKSHDTLRSGTIRMALSAITTAEVSGKKQHTLADDEVVDVLSTEVKKRREAVEAFERGNRPEQAEKERREAAILTEFLPEQLDADAIAAIVSDAITATGAADEGIRAMGRVMGVVTPQTKGRADGSAVAAEVKRQLGNGTY